jgi:hypothetical protein
MASLFLRHSFSVQLFTFACFFSDFTLLHSKGFCSSKLLDGREQIKKEAHTHAGRNIKYFLSVL